MNSSSSAPESSTLTTRLPSHHHRYKLLKSHSKQECGCLKTLLKRSESALDNHVLACVFSIYLQNKQFTDGLSNKPFLIWLLTTPLHLRYVARLHCNLSLTACFADINVSQGSVTTYARRGGIFNIHLTTNLHRNFPVDFFNRLRFDRVMLMSLWPHFLAHPVCLLRSRTGYRLWFCAKVVRNYLVG